jgi:Fe2+ transport system protein FeoA
VKISLIKTKQNHKGRIAEIAALPAMHNKFMSLGLYKGREITKLSHFGLKGPVTIKVGRSIIALGHSMAAKIILESE